MSSKVAALTVVNIRLHVRRFVMNATRYSIIFRLIATNGL
jgi:hypothetical protein